MKSSQRSDPVIVRLYHVAENALSEKDITEEILTKMASRGDAFYEVSKHFNVPVPRVKEIISTINYDLYETFIQNSRRSFAYRNIRSYSKD